MARPTALKIDDEARLIIDWDDGGRRSYRIRELRDACPCATCREKRRVPAPETELPILASSDLGPLSIQKMEPIGNYAYGIEFSDGHNTGIFTFELLLRLGVSASSD